jgi:GH25 family lysozyme M1 (1,4-beta-N-acetylmuramidase)
MIVGYDISRWQGHVDFQKMKSYGASFVIIKAGQGNWKDACFDDNWNAAKGVLPRASYFYYDNRHSPAAQALTYWEIIKDDPETIAWLDLEDTQPASYSGWKKWFDFITHFWNLSGDMQMGIYSGYYFWMEAMTQATLPQKEWFAQFPLWLASYPEDPFNVDHSKILKPYPWTRYLILQSGTPSIGLEAGVDSREIDYNIFMGTDEQFAEYFKLTETLPLPDEEANMTRYTGFAKLSATPNVRIRRSYPDGQTESAILPGQAFKGDRIESGWMHVIEVGGIPNIGWSAVQFLTYTDNGVPESTEPTPEPPAEGTVTLSVNAEITLTDATGKVYVGTVMIDNVELIER